jgi:type IV secretion system protein VirD4
MSGIIVGKYQGRYLVFNGQQFVLLAAPTRSGKGVAVVIPNLLNFDDSVVVLDLKLENFKYTSGFRALHGQEVFLWAPFSEDFKTHRWNTLDTISRDRNFRVGDVLSLGQALYPSEVDSKDKFWNDSARNLFLGLVLYLMDTPDLPCTLGEVLRQASGKGMPIKEYIHTILVDRSNGANALSDECLDALGRFIAAPDNTLGNIISTFTAPLNIFANPIVDAATSASDFDLNDVRKKRMSIYIGIQPNRLKDASLLINLFFSQLINLNTKELPANNPDLRYQCLLVMDEFTAMGKVPIIATSNAFIAGYNIRLLTIIQSIGQLESVYKQDTRVLITNHALQILYPPREQKDANEYSEMLGYFTQKSIGTSVNRPQTILGNRGTTGENTSDQKRALMMPQELRKMDQAKEIVVVDDVNPILCHKARFFNDHVFIDRLKEVSPTLAALDKQGPVSSLLGIRRKRLPKRALLEHVAFVLNELSSEVPILDIDLHKAKMEKRVRAVKPKEAIDLSKLVVDVASLPKLDNPIAPSKESVSGLVDAFFGQLDWINEGATESETASAMATVEELGAVSGDGLSIEGPLPSIELHGEVHPVDADGVIIGSDDPGEMFFGGPDDGPGDMFARTVPALTASPNAKPGQLDLSLLDH